MEITFDSLNPNAKIFIYPSSRKFYPNELENLNTKITDFLTTWSTETTLKTAYSLEYNRFIIVGVEDDNNQLTTTQLDTLVSFIFTLQNDYDITLIDKMNVCFKQGEYVQYKELTDFKSLVKNKAVNAKTIVFDNLITTKKELKSHWELPIAQTWYERFL